MTDNQPRCEDCNGTGIFAGKTCNKCGGQGFRFTIEDDDPPSRVVIGRHGTAAANE